MGRNIGLVKTKTIKKRLVDVYLPTVEERARWVKEAEKRGMSLSQMVVELVGAGLAPEELQRQDRSRELELHQAGLEKELATARQRINELETLNDRLKHDLEESVAEALVTEVPLRKLDKRLNRILQDARARDGSHRPVSDVELRRGLGIGPKDEARLKAMNRQLEILELHGVVRLANKGWAWND